jgi:hypothetical protein
MTELTGPANTTIVTLVGTRGHEEAQLRWHWTVDGPRTTYALSLEWSGPALRAEGPDMFEALADLRRQLEPSGWLIAVQGARLDTFPSGMARDQGGGERVYICRPGLPARSEDLVDTLASAEPEALATVAEQEEYWNRWRSKEL